MDGPGEDAASSTSKFCQLCVTNTSKYTCPRCLLRTCSLTCSKRHKSLTRCTGERNKAGYIPMNQYTEGKFLDDYSWLEEGRRKVETWGKEIDERKLAPTPTVGVPAAPAFRGGFRGRGRGRGGSGGDGGWSSRVYDKETKIQTLQRALAEKGIYMQTLPEGMERRRLNQANWDAKTNVIHISVLTVFHISLVEPTSAGAQPCTKTFSYLLPRCALSATLAELYDKHPKRPAGFPGYKAKKAGQVEGVQDAGGSSGEEITAGSTSTLPSLSTTISDLVFTYRAPASNLPIVLSTKGQATPTSYLTPCDTATTLEETLDGQTFVEYPSLEIWLKEDWEAGLEAGRIMVVDLEALEQAAEEEEAEQRVTQQMTIDAETGGEHRHLDRNFDSGLGSFGGGSTGYSSLPKRPPPESPGFDEPLGMRGHAGESKRQRTIDQALAPVDNGWGRSIGEIHTGESNVSRPPQLYAVVEHAAMTAGSRSAVAAGVGQRPGLSGALVEYGSSDEEEGEI